MHIAAFLPLAVLPLALAESYEVKVGVNADGDEGYYYSPEKLTPKQGDTVVFSFSGSEHSVAQSTFDEPCEYVDNGINSGFPGAGKTFTITVNDTEPIWLFCTRPGHCQGGQALVLNEPQDNTLEAYKAAAKDAEDDGDNDEDLPVAGGVVADADDTATSTSASSAPKTTGGSTNTSSRLSASRSQSSQSVGASASASASATSAAAGESGASATTESPAATSTGAAGKFTAGAGLGAVGLLGLLVGGMV